TTSWPPLNRGRFAAIAAPSRFSRHSLVSSRLLRFAGNDSKKLVIARKGARTQARWPAKKRHEIASARVRPGGCNRCESRRQGSHGEGSCRRAVHSSHGEDDDIGDEAARRGSAAGWRARAAASRLAPMDDQPSRPLPAPRERDYADEE